MLERLDMLSASLPRKCLYCRYGYPVVFGTTDWLDVLVCGRHAVDGFRTKRIGLRLTERGGPWDKGLGYLLAPLVGAWDSCEKFKPVSLRPTWTRPARPSSSTASRSMRWRRCAMTDDERREVAAKLREMSDWDDEVDCTDFGKRVANLLWVRGCDGPEGAFYAALADLIEPTPTSSDTAPTCDREALLALADEMETADPEDLDVAIDYVTECASRIREACGEVA